MPKGTKVHKCVDKMKRKGGTANPYAVCQSATHQSYATGKPLSHMPKGASLSPAGDIGEHRVAEAGSVHLTIPGDGKGERSSSYLPYRAESMESDTPRIACRIQPKDKVV